MGYLARQRREMTKPSGIPRWYVIRERHVFGRSTRQPSTVIREDKSVQCGTEVPLKSF